MYFKKTFTSVVSAAALVAGSYALPCQAADKPDVLVLNVGELYNTYYRAQEAQEKLQAVIDAAQAELDTMIGEGRTLAQGLEELQAKLNNPSLSEDARKKLMEQAQPKLKELQEKENAINQFRQEKQNQFNERRQAMLNLYLGEIGDAAAKLAKQKGARYVVNANALVYFDGAADITEELGKTMNAGREKPASRGASAASAAGVAPAQQSPQK
jgi:Skp family chaperone for outer membrane proteins